MEKVGCWEYDSAIECFPSLQTILGQSPALPNEERHQVGRMKYSSRMMSSRNLHVLTRLHGHLSQHGLTRRHRAQ